MGDKIVVRDLVVSCIIGINDEERRYPQNVNVSLVIETDLRKPGRSDRIEDTLDYKALKNRLVEHIENSRFFLIERLAESIAEICLEQPLVFAVTVTVDKPGALTTARSVAVEIERHA